MMAATIGVEPIEGVVHGLGDARGDVLKMVNQ